MTNDPLTELHGPRRLPSPAGAERAVAAGRRKLRRRRTTTAAAGVSLSVIAGAALTGSHGGGHAGLVPSGHGWLPSGAPATPTAQSSAPAGAPSPAPAVTPTLPPLPTAGPPSPPPDDPADPGESPSATPTAAPRYLGTGSRAISASTTHRDTACATQDGVGLDVRDGWCMDATGPDRLDAGTPGTYTATLCRTVGTAAATLTFADGELQVVASWQDDQAEHQVWTLTDPSPSHTVTFQPGDCRVWTFEWMGQDDAGYAVRSKQSYQVWMLPTADELAQHAQGAVANTYVN